MWEKGRRRENDRESGVEGKSGEWEGGEGGWGGRGGGGGGEREGHVHSYDSGKRQNTATKSRMSGSNLIHLCVSV